MLGDIVPCKAQLLVSALFADRRLPQGVQGWMRTLLRKVGQGLHRFLQIPIGQELIEMLRFAGLPIQGNDGRRVGPGLFSQGGAAA